MKSKRVLTIAIPTYNRASILDEALGCLLPLVHDYDFQVIVSDNASTDGTKEVVDSYKLNYANLIYFRQKENIRDKNYITCYELSDSDYVWVLGDCVRISSENLAKVNRLLCDDEKYDAIVLNARNRVKGINSGEYVDPERLLIDIGWHLGLLSSTIVSKKMIMDETIWRYAETNFIHFGFFIEYMCRYGAKVFWLSEFDATHTQMDRSATSWLPRAFDVYGRGYMAFVFSLPSQISIDVKLKCIKDHGLKSGLFMFKNLCYLKSKGWLQFSIVKKYSIYFPFLTVVPYWFILLLSVVPGGVVRFMVTVLKKLRLL